ncbi:uncharacterized [Tachysurus ichikawai]
MVKEHSGEDGNNYLSVQSIHTLCSSKHAIIRHKFLTLIKSTTNAAKRGGTIAHTPDATAEHTSRSSQSAVRRLASFTTTRRKKPSSF